MSELTVPLRVRPGASRTQVGGRYSEGEDAALVTGATARTKVVAIDREGTTQAPEEILRGLLGR